LVGLPEVLVQVTFSRTGVNAGQSDAHAHSCRIIPTGRIESIDGIRNCLGDTSPVLN